MKNNCRKEVIAELEQVRDGFDRNGAQNIVSSRSLIVEDHVSDRPEKNISASNSFIRQQKDDAFLVSDLKDAKSSFHAQEYSSQMVEREQSNHLR